MPSRAPTDRQLARSRQQSDRRYNAERRAVHGPDPRSTARWQKLRRMILAEHPLCKDIYGTHAAEGRVVIATEVDHIVGISAAPERIFDADNLQPLCTRCHAHKSRQERELGGA